jgi:hypothetical protein
VVVQGERFGDLVASLGQMTAATEPAASA